MKSSELGSHPENQEKEPQEVVALKWHLLQLGLIEENLDKTNLTAVQKQRARALLKEIKQLSETPEPSREKAELGSVKALTDAWGSAREACINDDNLPFTSNFKTVAKKAGWNVEMVERSENALFVCTNDQDKRYIVYNPLKSSDINVSRFFQTTPDSSKMVAGRMIDWELVEPAIVADGIGDMKIDVYTHHSVYAPGLLRVVKKSPEFYSN